MVELEAWYDQAAENDYGPGEPAYLLRTVAELNALVERVLTETAEHRCGTMIQLNIKGQRLPVLEVGLGQEKAFIQYHAAEGGSSTKGEGSPDERVEYVYMGNLSEVQADAEVDIATVRRGLVEFLETGRRPSVVKD